jgi:G:T/U-mismatch repair DNA glycosylase
MAYAHIKNKLWKQHGDEINSDSNLYPAPEYYVE